VSLHARSRRWPPTSGARQLKLSARGLISWKLLVNELIAEVGTSPNVSNLPTTVEVRVDSVLGEESEFGK